MFAWSPSVAFLCFFSMLLFPFIPCHPIDTESILLKASIPSKILFSFRGLNVCNSVCAWMGLWMWKCQCHFSFTSSPPFTRSTYPSIPYAKLCYYVLYLWWKSSMKTIFHNHVCFAWNWCTGDREGRGEAHENRALKYIEISRTICRFVSIDRINSKLAKQKWSV